MAKFEVIASPDFQNGETYVLGGSFSLKHKTESLPALFGTVTPKIYNYTIANDVQIVEIQTEESVRKLSSAAGWGLAGAALGGPIGLLLGALWGGKKKELVCFSVMLKDEKKFLVLSEQSIYRQFVTATFGY